ncbi:MAG: DNA-3-methyladenine glycosylase 2 family protein [Ruminococcaceae bacterium]|nr:DNA-3-methyladenine glycosylase 2 family protein [Oscillospiraceae bacterium]
MPSTICFTLPCGESFDLIATLISGQCFRWTAVSDTPPVCRGIAGDCSAIITQKGSVLEITCDDIPDARQFWRRYLDLDTDYDAIRAEVIAMEPRLAPAAARCAGLHILNQQPWEALCSFIISQNNNIPRIRAIIERICALCAGFPPDSDIQHPFPSPHAVAALSEAQLREAGCGYRTPYIIETARQVAEGSFALDTLYTLPVGEARESLQSLHGVGPKVADCVLLFGLHRLECFPRDTWIKKALAGDFRDTPLENSRYAGVAQQYIFEYIRQAGN